MWEDGQATVLRVAIAEQRSTFSTSLPVCRNGIIVAGTGDRLTDVVRKGAPDDGAVSLRTNSYSMRQLGRFIDFLLISGVALLAGVSACSSFLTERPVIDAIAIKQVADTLDSGQAVAFSASLRAGGVEVANDGALRWASSSPAVFSINSFTGAGQANDVSAPSTVTVTATLNALSATSSFVVFPKVPGVQILMSSSVAVGHAVTPTVLLNTLQLSTFTGQPTGWAFTQPISGWGARFESLNPAILRVNSDGTLTAVAPGTSRVTVNVHGARDSVSVTVLPGYTPMFLPGTDGLSVVDVNDNGDVVAMAGLAQSTLIRAGQKIDLGSCAVQGINNRGQVLLERSWYGPPCPTRVYDNGLFTEVFGTGPFQGRASGIDEAGAVFGMLTAPDSLRGRAFLWRSGTFDVFPNVGGMGLASTGRVAGGGIGIGRIYVSLSPSTLPQILRLNGKTGFLQGLGNRYDQTLANDINDAENVVGAVYGRARLWLKSDDYQGQFLDTGISTATGISEANDIVGGGPQGAFFWSGGRYVVVSDAVSEAGWSFSNSPVISRNGTIAVTGTNLDGRKGIVLVKLQ